MSQIRSILQQIPVDSVIEITESKNNINLIIIKISKNGYSIQKEFEPNNGNGANTDFLEALSQLILEYNRKAPL